METTANRELRITRTFKAPIELMWEVWTDPEHIANWWGPNGFTTTIHKMNIEEGGEWNLTLHGPDGTNYPNHSIYKEIIPLKKIVFQHFNPNFITTVLFETAELRDIVVKAHKADDGMKQNVERLENYLSKL